MSGKKMVASTPHVMAPLSGSYMLLKIQMKSKPITMMAK